MQRHPVVQWLTLCAPNGAPQVLPPSSVIDPYAAWDPHATENLAQTNTKIKEEALAYKDASRPLPH